MHIFLEYIFFLLHGQTNADDVSDADVVDDDDDKPTDRFRAVYIGYISSLLSSSHITQCRTSPHHVGKFDTSIILTR